MSLIFWRAGRKFVNLALVISVLLISGCFLFPKKFEYNSRLASALPKKEFKTEEGDYQLDDDGKVSFNLEGLRIEIQPMSDEELNKRFPEESSQGKYSTNPYTYGDWIDPNFGYTPDRFSVFEVAIYNYLYAKVELDPVEAVLLTDDGEILNAYGISSLAPYGSFERYYRSRRGQSGNEYYRFDYRMGVVRSTYYGQDEPIFKGENYSGFIAFDPLRPEVRKVRLLLRNFVLKFDSFGRPLETVDVPFDFNRDVRMAEITETEEAEEAATTRTLVEGPREITGNLPGDIT